MKRYSEFVEEGTRVDGERERLLLGALGLNTEAGEAGDILKKHAFHGVDLDRAELVKELGDVLWYFTVILNETGISVEEVMWANVLKLTSRYPERHTLPGDYGLTF